MDSASRPFKLHIGGQEIKSGWKIFNIQPGEGVDYVGNISDLSRFADESCDEIYASHVLEHVPHAQVIHTLRGFHRILKPTGHVMVSVPDLEVLCRLSIDPTLPKAARLNVMRIMFGAQFDATDFHHTGLTFEFLSDFFLEAGFSNTERVKSFGLFRDASDFAPSGIPISLNVVARK